MKKDIMFVVLISLLYSCKVNNDEEVSLIESNKSIKGNWYYFIEQEVSSSKEDNLITYNEVYIGDKKVYHNLELVGYLKSEEYKISNDSFFSRDYSDKMLYKGKIENFSEDNFDLTYNSQVIHYHKVKDGITFGDIILKVDSLDSYIKDYSNRLLKAKKENVH